MTMNVRHAALVTGFPICSDLAFAALGCALGTLGPNPWAPTLVDHVSAREERRPGSQGLHQPTVAAIRLPHQLCFGHLGGHRRFEDAGAVYVYRRSMLLHGPPQSGHLINASNGSTADVVRVNPDHNGREGTGPGSPRTRQQDTLITVDHIAPERGGRP